MKVSEEACTHPGGCCCHHHEDSEKSPYLAPAISFAMLIVGISGALSGWPVVLHLIWYIAAFLPVGLPVMKEAWEGIMKKDIFNEFTLMSIACIGAFCIREYPEAVGVMLFYSIGETLQDKAADRARASISRLLDVRGERANLVDPVTGKVSDADPKNIRKGESIEIRPGERIPLDGTLESATGVFDTSALTGESMPRELERGGEVLAGMISVGSTVRIKVTREYGQTNLSRILELVENAAGRKARTELFIRRFSRIYTPIVVGLAVLLTAVPWLVSLGVPSYHYVFSEWLYRALVFLVLSCPCALVISVPLAYFAGIGAASKSGILVKGGNYLEAITKIGIVAFDKTGTLTTGKFHVEKVESERMPAEELLAVMAGMEQKSTHPLAKALTEYVRGAGIPIPESEHMKERGGLGIVGRIKSLDKTVVVGNLRLMKNEGIAYPPELDRLEYTLIACGMDGEFVGYVVMADTPRATSAKAVEELEKEGVKKVVMLSGDRRETVRKYAEAFGIRESYGELMPGDKASFIAREKEENGTGIAFVGDGMNDAPVLTLSDVGIAMGGLGSDAAIESADIVIQTDDPSKVATAIRIGKKTHTIVVENIVGAIGVKAAVLILGAFGIASLWAAVFADVGVALLAVCNSLRIFRSGKY